MTERVFISDHDFGGVRLKIASTAVGVCRIHFHEEDSEFLDRWLAKRFPRAEIVTNSANHRQAIDELTEYFEGKLRVFKSRLDLRGTDFQKKVWAYLKTIPFGQTRSYADVARAIGAMPAIRAVGAANGSNPIPIIVPCHRVIGSDGSLTGYGGGLDLKRRLLGLERVPLSGEQRAFEFMAGT